MEDGNWQRLTVKKRLHLDEDVCRAVVLFRIPVLPRRFSRIYLFGVGECHANESDGSGFVA